MPVELRTVDVICVDGESLSDGWMVPPTVVGGGTRMLDLPRGSYQLRKFLGRDFTMYDHIKKLRDRHVVNEMKRKCHEVELDEEAVVNASLPKRPKRSMIDDVDDLLTVDVILDDDTLATVRVASTFSYGAVLRMEYTKENMELLLKTPQVLEPVVLTEFVPVIADINVGWCKPAKGVYCRWWDSDAGKYKRKTMSVKLKGDSDDMQAQVDSMAKVCQVFYDEHHTEPEHIEES